ncbi:FitA-like ribbon-helix-helix domain-containing protein [Microbacterium sp.]|uniref:FitA-like ribbon-helix-helix domain-containing protein n=1 Tax=Microbacterium sp. TaxID=51671 RepID=UPI003C774E0B
MPALHIRDVPEETVAAIKRQAERHGRSMQQELRAALEQFAADAAAGARPHRLRLHTVTTGRTESFDRGDFYDDDER